jgi:Bacterial CdiA-CT RNAse A domain
VSGNLDTACSQLLDIAGGLHSAVVSYQAADERALGSDPPDGQGAHREHRAAASVRRAGRHAVGLGVLAHRAHVVAVHVAEAAPELRDRLRFDPGTLASSTFSDRATAQKAVQEVIDANQQDISAWLASDNPKSLPMRGEADSVVGKVLTRDAWEQGYGPVETRRLRVVLQRSAASPTGFVVLTAFPELK